MAKENRASDLDAELAELEAELAALEGRKPKKAKKTPAPPPAAAAPQEAASEAAPAPEPAKKGRFSLPIKKPALPAFGRKHEPAPAREEPAAAAPPPAEALPEPAPAAPPVAAEPAPEAPWSLRAPELDRRYDATLWRQDGDAWVRVVPQTPVPVVRRVLDENGNVVREEPASRADVDEVSGVKAERGLGKLFRRKSA